MDKEREQLITNTMKSLLTSFTEELKTTFTQELKIQISEDLKHAMQRQFATKRKLSSEQIKEYTNKIEYSFKKLLIKENDMKIIQTHLDKDTAPTCLSHQKHPVPFLSDDKIYFEKYNKIIFDHQRKVMNLIIERLTEEISIIKMILIYIKIF